MRSEKGITLVALILIILLLLVLAGLTVALVLSNESQAPADQSGTSIVEVEDIVTSEEDNSNVDADASVDVDGDETTVEPDVEPAA